MTLATPLTLVGLLLAQPAWATLLDLGAVTRDSESGLDWLDPSESTGLSYDEIVAGSGGFIANGWRHATGAEVCDLFMKMGAAPSTCPGTAKLLSIISVAVHRSLLGTTEVEGDRELMNGIYDDGEPTSAAGLAAIQVNTGLSLNIVGFINIIDNDVVPGASSADTGHLLVRPVPEPSAALLLGSGLVGLAMKRHGRGRASSSRGQSIGSALWR